MRRGTEIKVGIFVIIGLALTALLILQFNKSAGPFEKTYRMRLVATNIAGVYAGSSVSMAGVSIGSVERIELVSMDGKTLIHARLQHKYPVRTNSQFVIRQSGFIGDQYIAVMQGSNDVSVVFKEGDDALLRSSFDIAEAGKSATDLLQRVTDMVGQVSNAIHRVDTTLLSTTNLAELTETVGNLKKVSDRALGAVTKIDQLLETNGPALTGTISNAQTFTVRLNGLTDELRQTLSTNREQLTASIANIEKATAKLDQTMTDVNEGKGPLGALIKSEQMTTDLSLITSNLAVLSSNVNNKGLWGVLRKPKVETKKSK